MTRGKTSKAFDNDLSLNWLTRSGLRLSSGARYNAGDVKPPLYPTGDAGEYFVGIKMPLLRGFRINEKLAAELQAQIGIPAADAAYEQTRLSLLLQAAYAYWDWVIAQRKVGVSQSILALSQTRSQAIQERVDKGDAPAMDAVEARQEVVRREGFWTKANRDYEKQALKLSRYLWEPQGSPAPAPQANGVPAQSPQLTPFDDDDWMAGRQTALENRPELKALNLEKETTVIDLKLAKNQRLPIMDILRRPATIWGTIGRSDPEGRRCAIGAIASENRRRDDCRGQV